MTPQPDLATSLMLARLRRAHPGADVAEILAMALEELDRRIAALGLCIAECDRRLATIEATGRPTGGALQ